MTINIASYFGSPSGLLRYLDFMSWVEKKHPELLAEQKENPEPDKEYEAQRDFADEEIRTAAEEGVISEREAERLIEEGTEQEREEAIRKANEEISGREMVGDDKEISEE